MEGAQLLVTAARDGRLRVWDMAVGLPPPLGLAVAVSGAPSALASVAPPHPSLAAIAVVARGEASLWALGRETLGPDADARFRTRWAAAVRLWRTNAGHDKAPMVVEESTVVEAVHAFTAHQPPSLLGRCAQLLAARRLGLRARDLLRPARSQEALLRAVRGPNPPVPRVHPRSDPARRAREDLPGLEPGYAAQPHVVVDGLDQPHGDGRLGLHHARDELHARALLDGGAFPRLVGAGWRAAAAGPVGAEDLVIASEDLRDLPSVREAVAAHGIITSERAGRHWAAMLCEALRRALAVGVLPRCLSADSVRLARDGGRLVVDALSAPIVVARSGAVLRAADVVTSDGDNDVPPEDRGRSSPAPGSPAEPRAVWALGRVLSVMATPALSVVAAACLHDDPWQRPTLGDLAASAALRGDGPDARRGREEAAAHLASPTPDARLAALPLRALFKSFLLDGVVPAAKAHALVAAVASMAEPPGDPGAGGLVAAARREADTAAAKALVARGYLDATAGLVLLAARAGQETLAADLSARLPESAVLLSGDGTASGLRRAVNEAAGDLDDVPHPGAMAAARDANLWHRAVWRAARGSSAPGRVLDRLPALAAVRQARAVGGAYGVADAVAGLLYSPDRGVARAAREALQGGEGATAVGGLRDKMSCAAVLEFGLRLR